MNEETVCRNLSFTDIPHIFRLGTLCFDWPSESVLWTETTVQWYYENAQQVSFVAEHAGSVVGFALSFVRDNMGYLGWCAVDPQWRRRGIGTELCRKAVPALQSHGARSVAVIAREDGRMDRLLKELGFRSDGFRKVEMLRVVDTPSETS